MIRTLENFLLPLLSFVVYASAGEIGPTRKIAEGVVMPRVSLGHPDGNVTKGSTKASVLLWLSSQVGGVGIDTAYDYNNQKEIAAAISESGRERSSLFITTKFPGAVGHDSVMKYTKTDLQQLNLTYVDLLLMHSPCDPKGGHFDLNCTSASEERLQDTWRGMEEALQNGLTRAIGISNFKVDDIKVILSMPNTVKPAINQCKMNIGYHDDVTQTFCEQNDIVYEAYSPLERGGVNATDERLVKIATAHNKSVFQVCLRWIVQQDCMMAVSATSVGHDLSDLALFDFTLSDDEMKTLSGLVPPPSLLSPRLSPLSMKPKMQIAQARK